MKRINAACLQQTIHFMLKEDIPQHAAVKAVNEELGRYKAQMEK